MQTTECGVHARPLTRKHVEIEFKISLKEKPVGMTVITIIHVNMTAQWP